MTFISSRVRCAEGCPGDKVGPSDSPRAPDSRSASCDPDPWPAASTPPPVATPPLHPLRHQVGTPRRGSVVCEQPLPLAGPGPCPLVPASCKAILLGLRLFSHYKNKKSKAKNANWTGGFEEHFLPDVQIWGIFSVVFAFIGEGNFAR